MKQCQIKCRLGKNNYGLSFFFLKKSKGLEWKTGLIFLLFTPILLLGRPLTSLDFFSHFLNEIAGFKTVGSPIYLKVHLPEHKLFEISNIYFKWFFCALHCTFQFTHADQFYIIKPILLIFYIMYVLYFIQCT